MTDQIWNEKIVDHRLVEGAFAEDETLTELVIPEGVEDIGEVAFFGCVNLRSITLPESLKIIREEAFGESGLESVRIPEGTERICEKAFFSCPDLARIDVLSPDTAIETGAFGMCPNLLEGYVACGYPAESCPPELIMSGSPTRDLLYEGAAEEDAAYLNPPEELLYTLLWCTCPERHGAETSARAEAFIRKNEKLVMEHILKNGNTAAMNGLASRKFLRPENIGGYIDEAGARHETEIVALLLTAAAGADGEDEFAL